MASITTASNEVPYKDPIGERSGLLTRAWQVFFRNLYDAIRYIGAETSAPIENDVAVAQPIPGMRFDSAFTTYAAVDYFIQRVTDSNELVEAGTFYVVYRPDSETWDTVFPSPDPDDSGVDISIDTNGQAEYVSTDVTGTIKLSRIVWRARTMAGKSHLYSKPGAGR